MSDKVAPRDAGRAAWSFLTEFRNFALRGNVVDLAIGVVIGAAFAKIVDSLVTNVIMPLISYVTPKTDFSDWRLGKVAIGIFLNDVISFLIVALALYVFLIKFLGWLTQVRADPQAKLTRDQALLTEIRDLLKNPPATRVG